MSAVHALASKLEDLHRRLRALESTPQLAHSSLESGSIEVYEGESLRGTLGRQADGTSGLLVVNGGPPPKPSAALVAPSVGGFTVLWDGENEDGTDTQPLDWSRCEVHVNPGHVPFEATVATLRGTIETPQGGTFTYASETDLEGELEEDFSVVLVFRNTSGTAGSQSERTTTTTGGVPVSVLRSGTMIADILLAGSMRTSLSVDDFIVIDDGKIQQKVDGTETFLLDETGAYFRGNIEASVIEASTLVGSYMSSTTTAEPRVQIDEGSQVVQFWAGTGSDPDVAGQIGGGSYAPDGTSAPSLFVAPPPGTGAYDDYRKPELYLAGGASGTPSNGVHLKSGYGDINFYLADGFSGSAFYPASKSRFVCFRQSYRVDAGSEAKIGTAFIVDQNGVYDTSMRVRSQYVAAAVTTTSTSYVFVGADVDSVTFRATTSGAATVAYESKVSNSVAGATCFVSVQVLNVDTAVVFLAASTDTSAEFESDSADQACTVSGSFSFSGLTPGAEYRYRVAYAVSSGTGTFARRRVTVTPSH